MSRRLLQLFFRVLGVVAVVFGLQGVLTGVAGVYEGRGSVDLIRRGARNVDSELRFFAAWYVLAGTLVLRAARRPENETAAVRSVCAALWLAAIGRLLSIRVVGRPHRRFVVLLGIELAIPVVALSWQASVARGPSAAPRPTSDVR